MDLTTTKIVVALLFGILRFFFGVLPVKLYKCLRHWEEDDDSATFINQKRHNQVNCAIALCQSFGGGVLFATCFLHMMLDVYKSVEELKKYGNLNTDYPLSQLIISAGFFFVYFLEEISHWLITEFPPQPCPMKKIKIPHNVLRNRMITPVLNKVSPVKEQDMKIAAFTIDEEMKRRIEKEEEAEMSGNEDAFSIHSDITRNNEKNLKLNDGDGDEDEEDKPPSAVDDEKILIHEEKTQQQILRFILIAVALSFHALFEGLAIGIQQNIADIWYLFTAVSIHSVTILFCIGLEMLLARTKLRTIYIQMLILALSSPIGVILGLIITLQSDMNTKAKSTAVVLLEGLSTGTIIYITFFEVLNREKVRRVYRLRRAVCILGGFTLMAVLQYLEISH